MSKTAVNGKGRVRVHEKAMDFADNILPNVVERLNGTTFRINIYDGEDPASRNLLLHVDVDRLQLLDLLFP